MRQSSLFTRQDRKGLARMNNLLKQIIHASNPCDNTIMEIQNASFTQDPLLAGLNNKQLEAVTLPHQSALILAGAGSGKTRVLTARIAWLIQTGQVSPTGLLAVTFTNKTAKEMLTRITASLPTNYQPLNV